MEELELKIGQPKLVTPTNTLTLVQNTMTTNDDPLYVSTHGDMNKRWLKVPPGGSVKFDQPTYLMQKSWATHVFPVYEE